MTKACNIDAVRGISRKSVIPGYCEQLGGYISYSCGILVTMRCNLKCKYCSQKVHMYPQPPHPALDDLKAWIDGYFRLIDYTYVFIITGGEPLLRNDLDELSSCLLKYREQFGILRINTNGTIVPPDNLIAALCEYGEGAEFLINRYGASARVGEITDCLQENSIAYTVRDYSSDTPYLGGWFDFGDYREEHEANEKCYRESIYYPDIHDGKLYVCPRQIVYSDFGPPAGNNAGNEYIDLTEKTDIAQKRDKLSDLWQLHSLASCRFCKGRADNRIGAGGIQL